MEQFLNELLCESGVRDLPEEAVERKFQMLAHEINPPVQDICSSSSSAFCQFEKHEVSSTSTSRNMTEENLREKKRKADQTYRIRLKEDKKKLDSHFHKLVEENKRLKTEKYTLTRERDEMKNGLVSANNEAKKLKREISELRRTGKSQETIIGAYSQTFHNEKTQQEILDLKKKIEVLSTKKEDWMMEKEDLLRKVGDLEHKSKLFQVQIKALCQRIIKTDSEES